jgi:hypothetical protein
MKLIKATCQTQGCSYKGKTSEFVSEVELTQCAECGNIITDLVIEEVTNGSAEETE